MKKNYLLCVDLITLMKQGELQVADSRRGTLYRNDEDRFTFTEKGAHERSIHPELHWHTLDKSRYGRLSANANHIKLELYIPHGDYADGCDLADLLASQVDQMGENLCEMNLKKTVESIRSLKQKRTCQC